MKTHTQFGLPFDMIAFNENLAAKIYRFNKHEVGPIRKFESERIGCLLFRSVHRINFCFEINRLITLASAKMISVFEMLRA